MSEQCQELGGEALQGWAAGSQRGQGLGPSSPLQGLSFPLYEVRGNLPRPPASPQNGGRCLGKGTGGSWSLSGRAGPGRGGAGVLAAGGRAGGAGPADRARRLGWLGTCGQARRAVRAAAELAACRPLGSHEPRRRVPTATRSWALCSRSPAARRSHPALTMSVCCCFFFRDYGSSKRKSGKRAPGRFSPPTWPPAWCTRLPDPAEDFLGWGAGGVSACPAVLLGRGTFSCPAPQPMPYDLCCLRLPQPSPSGSPLWEWGEQCGGVSRRA